MTILNESLDWNILAANDPDLRKAFRGTPTKILLPTDRCLCRFVTSESETQGISGNNIFLSPWWLDWKTTWNMLAQWKTPTSTPKQIIRGRLAVTKTMNQQLDSMVQIVLTSPVYAWEGIAQYQQDGKLGYLGGATQLYLPNLSGNDGRYSPVSHIHCHTSIDALLDG